MKIRKLNNSLKIENLFFGGMLFLAFVLPQKIMAQSFSLSIAPAQWELVIKPGKSYTKAYNLTNSGQQDLYLTTSIVPFIADQDSGDIIYNPDTPTIVAPQFSLQNADLKLGERFVIPAGKKRQLVLKITIPENTPLQDYYYTFFIESQPSTPEVSFGTSGVFAGKIGSHLLLSVSDTAEPDFLIKISSFKAIPKIADQSQEVIFKIKTFNAGNFFSKVGGEIKIINMFKKQVKALALKPKNVLAQAARELKCETGNCSFATLWPGIYQAYLTIDDQKAKTTFVVLPLKLTLILIILILLYFFAKKPRKLDN